MPINNICNGVVVGKRERRKEGKRETQKKGKECGGIKKKGPEVSEKEENNNNKKKQ